MLDSIELRIWERIQRQWIWLGLALVMHVAAAVAVMTAVSRIGGGPADPVVVLLAAAGPIMVVWLEVRSPVRRRPARWLRRAFCVVTPQAVAVGLAGATAVGVGLIVAVLQLGCVVMAARAVRYPLRAELGAMKVDVCVKLRSAQPVPGWVSMDEVWLTDQDLVVRLQPGPASLFEVRIPFCNVSGVTERPARPKDSPWIRLDDGHEYGVPPGEVMEVRHRDGSTALPVRQPAALAEVLRTRIATQPPLAE